MRYLGNVTPKDRAKQRRIQLIREYQKNPNAAMKRPGLGSLGHVINAASGGAAKQAIQPIPTILEALHKPRSQRGPDLMSLGTMVGGGGQFNQNALLRTLDEGLYGTRPRIAPPGYNGGGHGAGQSLDDQVNLMSLARVGHGVDTERVVNALDLPPFMDRGVHARGQSGVNADYYRLLLSRVLKNNNKLTPANKDFHTTPQDTMLGNLMYMLYGLNGNRKGN